MRIAIVGATGAVGREMLAVLERSRLPKDDVVALASPRSAGQPLPFAGRTLTVEALVPGSFRGVKVALVSAGSAVSEKIADEAVKAGAVMIDNSSFFRMRPDVPLVVPEVNAHALAGHKGLIANPNCSTAIMVLALAPLAREYGLESVVVSTYQAVSGAGWAAIEELKAQQANPASLPKVFPHPIADNLIPFIDKLLDGGHSREELKLLHESRKILELPSLMVRATCVRVPVMRAHSEAVSVTTTRPIDVAAARALFARSPGLVVQDDPARHDYPMPKMTSGKDPVGIGRIRQAEGQPRTLDFWLCGDQLLKGAALNAVQIAERLFA